jgi:hypothetical protein
LSPGRIRRAMLVQVTQEVGQRQKRFALDWIDSRPHGKDWGQNLHEANRVTVAGRHALCTRLKKPVVRLRPAESHAVRYPIAPGLLRPQIDVEA